jgi:hypothetical protein
MSIQVVWDDEQHTIIRYVFDRTWEWQDFFEAKAQAYGMIDAAQRKISVIMDAPRDTVMPKNMLTHFGSAIRKKHPNTAVVVVVIRTPFLRSMVNLLMRVSHTAKHSMCLVATLEEARNMARERLEEPTL